MSSYIVELPLKTEKYQDDILEKRFEIAGNIYNALVNVTQKRYREMVKTRKYRSLVESLSGNAKKDRPIWKEINTMRREYGLTEYSFHKDVSDMQKHFKENIDSHTAQKIASALWKSYEKLFYGNGKKVHYKRYGEIQTLESKTNASGIKFRNNKIYWNKLIIPVVIDYSNPYEILALKDRVKYCRIKRRYIKGKYKYYVHLVLEGTPPQKVDTNTGEIKRDIGTGEVGLDIGTSTIAISGRTAVRILELADKVRVLENEKRKLLRKMDRSRRATNPDNFNDDGTIKKQGSKKVTWIKSNHYIKLQGRLREIYRKQADVRKYQHECLANEIISLGDIIYVEKMSFSGLKKRAEKTETNEKGKFKRKKRFGKSIGNKAPAMLLDIIDRKLNYYGKSLIEINTKEARASQFNHFEETYKKKKLTQRWNNFNGIKVQRDMYSAFLIMNISEDLKTFDLTKCNDRFEEFKRMHDLEAERLSGNRNLSSIAI